MKWSLRPQPALWCLTLGLASCISALGLPPCDASSPAVAVVTQAPSADALELRLRRQPRDLPRRNVYTCAVPCIDAAVTKSTTCRLGDLSCECQSLNAEIIYLAAYTCMANACGYLVAANILSAASSTCVSVNLGLITPTGAVYTTDVYQPDPTSVVIVTHTNAAGSPMTSTYIVNSPTGLQAGPGDNNNGDSSDGQGLSKGVIIGIAVGGAGGIIIACVLLFVAYKCYTRRHPRPDASAATHVVTAAPPPAPTPPVQGMTDTSTQMLGGKVELPSDSKTQAHVAHTAVSPPSTVSRHPSVLSSDATLVSAGSVSPLPEHAAMYLPPNPSPPGPHYHYPQPAYAAELGLGGREPPSPFLAGIHHYHPPPPAHAAEMYGARQGGEGPPHGYAEVQEVRPEVLGDTYIPQELHSQAYGTGLYEMPSTPGRPR